MHIIATAVGFAQQQHAALIHPVDDPVGGDPVHCISQTSEGCEQVADVDDILGVGARFDHALPADPCVNSYPAFQVLKFTATVDPIGCACDSEILHKGAVIAHHNN